MKVYQAVVAYLGAYVSAFQYVFSKTINRTRRNGSNEPTFISVQLGLILCFHHSEKYF